MGKLRALVGKHRRDVDALGEGTKEGITAEGKRIIAALEKAEAEGGDVHARALEILAGTTVQTEREELERQERIKDVIAGPGGVTTADDESLKDFKFSELQLAIISEFPIIRNIVGAMAAGKLTAEAAQALIDGEYGKGVGKLLLAAAAIGVGGTAARLMLRKAARLRRAKRAAEFRGGQGEGAGRKNMGTKKTIPATGGKRGTGVIPNRHNANVTVRNKEGKIVSSKRFVSGSMTRKEEKLGFPKNTLASHTEARAVKNIKLKPGQTLEIVGQKPPCSPCRGAMNKAARQSGGKTIYRWREGGRTRTWIANSK